MPMASLDLRQAIRQRIQHQDAAGLYDVIEQSVHGEERALPGLGVLFEMLWEHSEEDWRQAAVQQIEAQINLEQQSDPIPGSHHQAPNPPQT